MINPHDRLTENFMLDEFLRSATAERQSDLKAKQYEFTGEVFANLGYLAVNVLQPLRDLIGYPIHITSGYRSPELNKVIGGSATSQHCIGEAADCHLDHRFVEDESTRQLRELVKLAVHDRTGHELKGNVNASFYLFALIALHMNAFDVDQVIHEYGDDFGRPAWVHIASSRRQNRREILLIGSYTDRQYLKPDLKTTLELFT